MSELKGAALLIQQLYAIDYYGTRAITKILKQITKPLVAEAKALAAKDTGALSESITSVVRQSKRSKNHYALIGPNRSYAVAGQGDNQVLKPSNYAHIVERGAQAHIQGKGMKAYKHPGQQAQPFVEPTMRAIGPAVMQTMADEIQKAIEEARRING